jgi:dTDP-4-amino-4,6-dideoxygalactose transaminase
LSGKFRFPFLVPQPPALSRHVDALAKIEASKRYTNFGPVNARFEAALLTKLFGGSGHCCTVANATLGLMLCVKLALLRRTPERPARFAILPSFTFAATAEAALWCGLKPLFCDIDPDTWLPDTDSIDALLRKHGSAVGVVIPYATFGNNLDLTAYSALSRKHDVPVVIDAAASLGSMSSPAVHFGTGSAFPIVFSMHATKTFATSEGGVIYARDEHIISALRQMSNFGFDAKRVVTLPGLNAKLPEVTSLLALEKLRELRRVLRHRERLVNVYRRNLEGVVFQKTAGAAVASQFMPARLAGSSEAAREQAVTRAVRRGIEVRTYFCPPLHRQPFFATRTRLPVTDEVSRNIISLPLHDSMTIDDVRSICAIMNGVIGRL